MGLTNSQPTPLLRTGTTRTLTTLPLTPTPHPRMWASQCDPTQAASTRSPRKEWQQHRTKALRSPVRQAATGGLVFCTHVCGMAFCTFADCSPTGQLDNPAWAGTGCTCAKNTAPFSLPRTTFDVTAERLEVVVMTFPVVRPSQPSPRRASSPSAASPSTRSNSCATARLIGSARSTCSRKPRRRSPRARRARGTSSARASSRSPSRRAATPPTSSTQAPAVPGCAWFA